VVLFTLRLRADTTLIFAGGVLRRPYEI